MMTALLFSARHAVGSKADLSNVPLASAAADHRPRRARVALSETSVGRSYGRGREGPDADQVVGREGKRKHPVHAAGAPVPRLAHQSDGLEPAEDLLDALASALTHAVARMPRGATVDRAGPVGRVLRHVRGHPQQPDRSDEIPRVLALVGPHRYALPALLSDIRKRGNLNRPAERHGQADALEGRRVASATRRR